jgi:hypothetical protein
MRALSGFSTRSSTPPQTPLPTPATLNAKDAVVINDIDANDEETDYFKAAEGFISTTSHKEVEFVKRTRVCEFEFEAEHRPYDSVYLSPVSDGSSLVLDVDMDSSHPCPTPTPSPIDLGNNLADGKAPSNVVPVLNQVTLLLIQKLNSKPRLRGTTFFEADQESAFEGEMATRSSTRPVPKRRGTSIYVTSGEVNSFQ